MSKRIIHTRDRRTIGTAFIKRAEGDDDQRRTVEGYALKFGEYSQNMGGWFEIIEPGALDGVLEVSDVRALFNHDPSTIMARHIHGRSSNTLSLNVDDTGLAYSFDAPATTAGDDLVVSLQRGDVTQSSFAFEYDKWRWVEEDERGSVLVIERFKKIYDVSPVVYPAYTNTEALVRSFDEYKKPASLVPYRRLLYKRRLQLLRIS